MREADDLYERARRAAVARLNRRECSSLDIHQGLCKKGFLPALAREVVLELIECNYIDDERYAQMLVRDQASHGKGPLHIRMKLQLKGIKLDLNQIKTLMMDAAQTTERDVIEKILAKRFPVGIPDRLQSQKMIQQLQRRGFLYEVAHAAVSQWRGIAAKETECQDQDAANDRT